MKTRIRKPILRTAIFAAALSLYQACEKLPGNPRGLGNPGEGMVGFLDECVRIAELFETWSASRVDFHELAECWPYFLQDHFGQAVLWAVDQTKFGLFQEEQCAQVAHKLKLPLKP